MTRTIGAPRGAADRIWRGSGALARRRGAALAGWVRKARRDDLKGIRAALGPMVRIAALVGGALAVYGALRAAPWLLWPGAAAWCWRAWKAATPKVDEALEEAADDAHAQAVTEAVLEWIRDMVGDRNGVHLSELLTNAQQHDLFEGMELPTFRAHLEARGVPVRQQLKVGGRNRPGVHRQDLPPTPGQQPEEEPAQGRSPAAA